MIYAVIKHGGKQYLVKEGDKIRVEKINVSEGDEVLFDKVLLVWGKNVKIGTPFLENAKVSAKVLKNGRAKKIIIFHYHSKTRYKKKGGHRQPFSEVEIKEIK
mgnify:CR=1 FL=1